MSRRLNTDWCTVCSEVCTSHPTICTVCGNPLESRNQETSVTSNTTNGISAAVNILQMHQSELMQQLEAWSANSTNVPGGDTIPMTDNATFWQRPPPEAFNPNHVPSASRPTSAECLKLIPRIKVEEHSAILHEISISLVLPPGPIQKSVVTSTMESVDTTNAIAPILKRKQIIIDAVMAEFPPFPPYEVTGRLVYGGTGKDVQQDQRAHFKRMAPSADPSVLLVPSTKTIAYMERGGGLTFVQKAIEAQKQGCSAVICGNNVPIWPYIMKDSTIEASKLGLNIPIVMVKRSDGARICELLCINPSDENNRCLGSIRATISAKRMSSDADDCVVCRDPFVVGDIVMRLPFCSHAFHENCAMSWLSRHNTCPNCRRELPTDDPIYEAERRRQQRTHAGSTPERFDGHDSPFDSLFV